MAAVTELSFLLFVLINNIHAEELIIILKERDSYTFELPEEANSSCLISRFVGEEKIVLWNTSDLWSQNSTVPKDSRGRLSVGSISNLTIHNLTHSDSGLYQEECWTKDKVTSEKNITIIICSSKHEEIPIVVVTKETMELPCGGAADNLDIQWLKREFGYEEEIWTRVFGDNTTSVMDNVKGRYQVVTNTSALHVSDFRATVYTVYTCLVMNQQQCVSSHPVKYVLSSIIYYRSVGEAAVLPCTVTDFIDNQPPHWKKLNLFFNADNKRVYDRISSVEQDVDQNYSLVFSSLMLNHTDLYQCETSKRAQRYFLLVCPKLGPPAEEFFSEGENITLRCRDWGEGVGYIWFIKSNQTDGRIFNAQSDLSMMSRVRWNYTDRSLVITNVSLEDTGEYWCAVVDQDVQCVSTNKTLLKHREPFGFHSTFYTVRCWVLSGLLVMLCVVVVAVNQRTRRGEQLSAETDS